MEYNHFAYGELLRVKLKPIDHYFKSSELGFPDEFHSKLSSINGTVLIALDGKNSDFEMNGAEALFKIPQYFFIVAKPAPVDNPEAILKAQFHCENICMQIQAHYLQLLSEPNAAKEFKCLDSNSFTIRGIRIGDNHYGCILGFNFKLNIEYKIDKSMWNE